jgi:hypothetical protein
VFKGLRNCDSWALSRLWILRRKGPKEAPLFLLSRIAGMLGACLTRASRLDERSTVAVLGEMLQTQLLARGGGGEDGALADAVASYLRSITIPDLFCAGAAGIEDLRIEAKEMMAYHRSVSGRREVERARLHHSRDGYLEGCVPTTSRPVSSRPCRACTALARQAPSGGCPFTPSPIVPTYGRCQRN